MEDLQQRINRASNLLTESYSFKTSNSSNREKINDLGLVILENKFKTAINKKELMRIFRERRWLEDLLKMLMTLWREIEPKDVKKLSMSLDRPPSFVVEEMLFKGGLSKETNRLREDHEFAGKLSFTAYPGIGPNAARILWDEEEVRSIDDLKKKLLREEKNKVWKRGSDPKSIQEAQLECLGLDLKRLLNREEVDLWRRLSMECLSTRIKKLGGSVESFHAGSFGRDRETSPDHDIGLIHESKWTKKRVEKATEIMKEAGLIYSVLVSKDADDHDFQRDLSKSPELSAGRVYYRKVIAKSPKDGRLFLQDQFWVSSECNTTARFLLQSSAAYSDALCLKAFSTKYVLCVDGLYYLRDWDMMREWQEDEETSSSQQSKPLLERIDLKDESHLARLIQIRWRPPHERNANANKEDNPWSGVGEEVVRERLAEIEREKKRKEEERRVAAEKRAREEKKKQGKQKGKGKGKGKEVEIESESEDEVGSEVEEKKGKGREKVQKKSSTNKPKPSRSTSKPSDSTSKPSTSTSNTAPSTSRSTRSTAKPAPSTSNPTTATSQPESKKRLSKPRGTQTGTKRARLGGDEDEREKEPAAGKGKVVAKKSDEQESEGRTTRSKAKKDREKLAKGG